MATEITQREAQNRARDARAVQLRVHGYNASEIAIKLGYSSPEAAEKAIKRVLANVEETVATEAVKLDLARMDKMLVPSFATALKGDLTAVNVCLKIIERRAKLLGLDAPTKVANTDKNGNDVPQAVQLIFVDPATGQVNTPAGNAVAEPQKPDTHELLQDD